MAWNKYYVMIANQDAPITKVQLEQLELDEYKAVGTVNLRQTNKPKTLFTGYYHGSIILVHPELPFKFLTPKPTAIEKRFIQYFPNATIAALVENSTVELFGFALIENGQKIRMKQGCDGEYDFDVGDTLPEETESYTDFKAMIDEHEEEDLIEEMGEEGFKSHLEFQAAFGVADFLTKRFLSKKITTIDFDEIEFVEYEDMT